jgi:hypothetical protein
MEEIYKVWKTTHWNKTIRVYEVSNKGNVKINGKLVDLDKDYNHAGYYRFGSGYPVHRAVAELFIPNPDNKPCIDHIDTNTFNNNVDNLRWVTYKENQNNPLTKQHKKNKSNKGRHWTDEQKRNISIGTKKAMEDPLIRQKISESKLGNKYAVGKRTTEQKQRIKEATKIAMNKPGVRDRIRETFLAAHRKWMNNGIDTKPISESEQQYYIDLGWQYGRLYCKRKS